jgi:hypothetical protein
MTTEKSILEEMKLDGCAVFVYKPSKFVNAKHEKQKSRYPSKIIKKESLKKFYQSKSLPLVAGIYVYTYIYMINYVYMYVCMHVYAYIYIYICIYRNMEILSVQIFTFSSR